MSETGRDARWARIHPRRRTDPEVPETLDDKGRAAVEVRGLVWKRTFDSGRDMRPCPDVPPWGR